MRRSHALAFGLAIALLLWFGVSHTAGYCFGFGYCTGLMLGEGSRRA